MKRILYLFVALVVAILLFSNCSREEERSTVVDWEGNEYKTMNYGGTWWMVENMRTTRTRDGQNIWVSSDEDKFSYTIPYCYFYEDKNTELKQRGCLYNWTAANQICPEGWHLPTIEDYEALTDYISSVDKYCYKGDQNAIAKAMASKNRWYHSSNDGSPGCSPVSNNASGFNAFPTGYFWHDTEGYYQYYTGETYFLLADDYDGNYAFAIKLRYDEPEVILESVDKSGANPVRCVKDDIEAGEPDVLFN